MGKELEGQEQFQVPAKISTTSYSRLASSQLQPSYTSHLLQIQQNYDANTNTMYGSSMTDGGEVMSYSLSENHTEGSEIYFARSWIYYTLQVFTQPGLMERATPSVKVVN